MSNTSMPRTFLPRASRLRPILMSLYAFMIYAVLLISLVSIVSTNFACGARGKAAASAVIDCGEAAIKSEIPNLLPTLVAILSGGSVDWQAQESALEGVAGPDAVACTVQAIAAAWNTPSAGSAAVGASALERADAPARSVGVQNATQLIQSKRWRYAPVASSSSAP